MAHLCRDCDFFGDNTADVCQACGSRRTVSHPDLGNLAIAHIDCDAFFAAIEKRDNSDLKDKPVIVGGGKRGVVATCCYIARLHGVRSAMPMFKALKACPEAVVVPPRREAYTAASRQIRVKLEGLTPLVQMISIDEGYLDLSGTQNANDASPAQALGRLAREIERDVGISISVGLSENKFLAKTASEMDKPRGFAALSLQEAPAFLAPKPIQFIHGVGAQLAKKLARDGLHTISDLQSRQPKDLMARYGETGLWLHQRANGQDQRRVHTDGERKSVSAERTFETDISTPSLLEDRLWQVCEETAQRAKRHDVEGTTITLKLKTKNFKTLTRSITLTQSTHLAQTLFRTVRPMLRRETGEGQSYRLIGVGISNLTPSKGDIPDLIDPSIEKRGKAERASDVARSKFGKTAVMTGRAIRLKQARKPKTAE